MSELVTGDAVVLGLRTARLPSRALAVVIDLLLAWTLYLSLTMALLLATASLDEAAFAAVQVGLFLLVLVGVPIAIETLSGGRSLGKLAAGLRVVREDGGPIRFRHALVRGALGVVEIQLLFGVVACIASLVSTRGRRLGDVFAGTLVVRERIPVPRGRATVPPPPPWLAGRLGELDLSRVPDGLWLAVRQYLMRAGQLDSAVSQSMAERLADDVTVWTGTPPPREVSAAEYLSGVVAERQARDARRAFAGAAKASVGTESWAEALEGGRATGAVGDGVRRAGGWLAPSGAEAETAAARSRSQGHGVSSASRPSAASGPGAGRGTPDEEAGPPRTGFVPPA
ncbi:MULTISPECIES: RDD family protein [unclassified Streptomyces]|uniref:RDD family protein n=1 Tax=unclassified Streptomyces TaxID=2593676 RepID=UPI002DDC8402|nr:MULTISPECIES: RDD family protein [unclassified Streptomyces]WSA94374.1 RDD family protein [Streptomyces sp. NBC_01795]WSS13004.1 RDD family protein [Streptomyces sp. NBC_01186]WSS41788.1 RDD family protein [Streptomyces sp. NBC_01187]